RREQAHERQCRDRFPGSRLADHPDDLAWLDSERNIIDDPGPDPAGPEVHAEVSHIEEGPVGAHDERAGCVEVARHALPPWLRPNASRSPSPIREKQRMVTVIMMAGGNTSHWLV